MRLNFTRAATVTEIHPLQFGLTRVVLQQQNVLREGESFADRIEILIDDPATVERIPLGTAFYIEFTPVQDL